MTITKNIGGLTIISHEPWQDNHAQILTPGACDFLAMLVNEFGAEHQALLQSRIERQKAYDKGELPDFLAETKSIRDDLSWKVAPIPEDLQDRRVEITGPVDRKMIINALNADVKVFMADFEDSQSPTWQGMVDGQLNLRDANQGTISYTNPVNQKHYQLDPDPAVLIARVRGLHLEEKHIQINGRSIPGALMDFGLYFFHNYQQRMQQGSGVYFYLPKLQSHQEAAWWSKVFHFTEQKFEVPTSTIRATLLIETLPAVFEMEEILHAMQAHIVGLNCGRWDYIFSYIKTLKNHPDRVLPDRQQVTMHQHFLNCYSKLLVKTCHKRGAFAMGGMAAFIPAKDPEANQAVLDKVLADKQFEANNGHDGTWVAHPGLAHVAMKVFDKTFGSRRNQLDVLRTEDPSITANDLLQPCDGSRTEQGMRLNIRVALQYIEAWISGNGCVPIYGLMEDAATAEISRTSIWQWIRHQKTLDNGEVVTKALFRDYLKQEAQQVQREVGEKRWSQGRFEQAITLLEQITTSDELVDFLTLAGYEMLD
jgi:malate synthase